MSKLVAPKTTEREANGIQREPLVVEPADVHKVRRRKKWWIIDPNLPSTADNLVTEDDTPVDGIYSERQQRLLALSASDSYDGQGRPFLAFSNVGFYYSPDHAPLVPDVMLSLDVTLPVDLWEKRNRVYMLWEYGKPPEIIIEVVSNKRGREETTRKRGSAIAGVRYYVIYDPKHYLNQQTLRVYRLEEGDYVEIQEAWFPELGLGLTFWQGEYEGRYDTWLRWYDQNGAILLTGKERAEQERQRAEEEQQRAEQERQRAEEEQQRAEQEHQRAEQERQRAEGERQRAERLAAQLRALGIEPEE